MVLHSSASPPVIHYDIQQLSREKEVDFGAKMGSRSGGPSGGLPSHSHGSYASSSSMRRRRKNDEETCFCSLKTLIKKSGTPQNPDRLFHTCPRYRENEYVAVAEGPRGVPETNGELEIDYEDWKVKLAWRIGSLEAEIALSFFLGLLNSGVGTKVMKLASYLVIATLDPLIVPAEIGIVAVVAAAQNLDWGSDKVELAIVWVSDRNGSAPPAAPTAPVATKVPPNGDATSMTELPSIHGGSSRISCFSLFKLSFLSQQWRQGLGMAVVEAQRRRRQGAATPSGSSFLHATQTVTI
ncbi:hypothetical protein Ahy_B05g076166 [Arachis hypogaea]|uniref:Zinc finger GRF-type domain-containing protein n=1 Tax=Arachis hypogaea TaxID=3818 RepID=A0A444Z2P5_ARAHY|nr:hypothetical protein Ahy_B05g076166 [Arachis hypogaea]